jgi:CRP/FNR family transcriptional regulator, nitrogen fixation regulation protein
MFIQSAATIQQRARPISCTPAAGHSYLFADRPELVGTKMSYGRDEEIYGEAEEAEFVYKVISGAVRTYKLLSDGRRLIGAFHLPGDVFGFESNTTHRLSAEALTDTVLLLCRRRALQNLAARDLEVARQLWVETTQSLNHAEEHMLLLGRKTATERVASFLLEMDARMQVSGAINLPMTRRDIADYLGLTLETVSRIVSQLQAEGTVVLSSARQIRVERRSKLQALGSEHSVH